MTVSQKILLILALSLVTPPLLRSSDQKVKSTVRTVTVFRDQALIERSAQTNLSSGVHTIVFGNLPPTLVDQSVRVSGAAGAAGKILDVKIETTFLDTIPEQHVRELQSRLKSLQDEQKMLGYRMVVLNSQKLFIDSLRNSYARDPRNTGRGFDDWNRMLTFLDKNLSSIFRKIQETQDSMEIGREKIKAVEREIRNSHAYSRKSQKDVLVVLNLERSGTVTLELSYLLSGASWAPLYEARVSSTTSTIQFTYGAQVRQSTNEDWKDVALTLSTARPSEGGAPPPMNPWFVDIQRPVPRPLVGANLSKAKRGEPEVTAEAPDEITIDAAVPLEQETALVESQVTSVAFRIPGTTSIPSDNAQHRVTVAVEELPVELRYASVPKHSRFAFLTAKTKNTSEYPFLPGPMNVFFGNSFVAASNLSQVLPGDEFETGLGIDEGIRVERKLLNRFTEYTGTFTSKKKITYDYTTKIENTKSQKIELLLQDQIPISRNEEIVVELITPGGKELRPDENGFLKWNLNMNPGEKREVKLKFSIEFPRDMIVSGLE